MTGMTGKEAIEWLIPPTNCSNGDENDPIRKHWIAYNMAIKALEREPKTGRWIKIEPYPMMEHEYECSECYNGTDNPFEKYCSECGAKMLPTDSEKE